MSSKRCFCCGQTKPADEFYRHPMMADGRLNKCRECIKIAVRKNRLDKLDYYRSYDLARANQPHRVAARMDYQQWYFAQYPMRRKANQILQRAIQSGKVQRQPCFVCGEDSAEGHHVSYDLPLDVSWLCRPHHAQLHVEHKAREG